MPLSHTDSRANLLWSCVVLFFTILVAIFTPIELAWFNVPGPTHSVTGTTIMRYSNGVTDVVFFLDIAVQFNMAFHMDNGQFVTSRAAIAKHYLKGWFWIDFVSAFPWEYVLTRGTGNE